MFDDVTDFFELVTDPQTYTNPSRTFVKVRDFVGNSGRQKLIEAGGEGAKRFAFVPLAVKGLDNLIDRSGIDPNRAVRNTIGLTSEDVRSAGQHDLLDDEVTLHATDEGPGAPKPDSKVSGWFDP